MEISEGNYLVTMYIDRNQGDEVEEKTYTFDSANDIYPRYKSLIFQLRDFQDEHIQLITDSEQLAKEINGNPNKHAKLLDMYLKEKQFYNVSLNVVSKP